MKRINNTSKALTSQNISNNTVVPSMGGSSVKVPFKPVPLLNNFVKSHSTTDLNNRKVGKYKLKKYIKNLQNGKSFKVVLIYKLKRTKYTIYSCKKVVPTKGSNTNIEGSIIILKNIFQSKEFKLNDLPNDIINSINKNIETFNNLYESQLIDNKIKLQNKEDKKKFSFFNGLDT